MRKYTKLLAITVSAAIFASALAGCSKSKDTVSTEPSKDEKPETITIGYQASADDKMYVKEKGLFEEELQKLGVKLKYVSFDAGRDINNAILAKTIDFGDLGDPPVTIAVANKIPYEVFWIGNLIGDSESLIVKNNANINSIKDLKGKKVATTVSSTSHYSLLSALRLEGLSDSDIQVVDLKPTDIVAAWQRGDIDAAYTWQPHLGKISADGKKLTSSKELAAKGAPTTNLHIVRKEFADKYPEFVSLYIKQLIKAQNEFKNNPDAVAEVLGKALQIDKAEALKQANQVVWLPAEEELSSKYLGTGKKKGDFAKSLKAVGDFLVEQKSLPSKQELAAYEEVINPKYLEDALKK